MTMKIKEKFAVERDPEITPDEWLFERFRNWRAKELAACDWTQLPDVVLVNKDEWINYRQILRDLPSKTDFANQTMPNKPND